MLHVVKRRPTKRDIDIKQVKPRWCYNHLSLLRRWPDIVRRSSRNGYLLVDSKGRFHAQLGCKEPD